MAPMRFPPLSPTPEEKARDERSDAMWDQLRNYYCNPGSAPPPFTAEEWRVVEKLGGFKNWRTGKMGFANFVAEMRGIAVPKVP